VLPDADSGDEDEGEEEEEDDDDDTGGEEEEEAQEEEWVAAPPPPAARPPGGLKRGRGDGVPGAGGEAGPSNAAPAPADPSTTAAPLPTTPPPLPPPGDAKTALRVAWEAAYVRFLWARARVAESAPVAAAAGAPGSRRGGGGGVPATTTTTLPPPESYSRGQHLRGADADAADGACQLVATAHAAALKAAKASLADVKREMKAAVRRRLLGPRLLLEGGGGGEASEPAAEPAAAPTSARPTRPPPRPVAAAVLTRAVFVEELAALLAAGGKVAPYGRGPQAQPKPLGGGRGGGSRTDRPDGGTTATPYKAARRGGGYGFGFGGGAAAGAGAAGAASLFTNPAAKRLAPAEAVRRLAAATPACLAWSPAFRQASSWASCLAIGTADGRAWVWRCDHPAHSTGPAAPPDKHRFTLVTPAGVRAFGAQATVCLAFGVADPVTSASATPPLTLVAGGGRGGVAVLTASIHPAGGAPSPSPTFTRAARLAPADGRAVTSLAVRLEKGDHATRPWSLRIAAGKAGGRVVAWVVDSSGAAAAASLARPPPPFLATCGDGRTITSVSWLPAGAAADPAEPLLYTTGEDGHLRLWAVREGGRGCLVEGARPSLPGDPAASHPPSTARLLPVYGAAIAPGGFRIATVTRMAAAAAKDAGVSKTMTFAALEKAGVGWVRPPVGRGGGAEAVFASLPAAAAAAAAGLRVAGGHGTTLLADLAAALRAPGASVAVPAVLEALEGAVRRAMGGVADLLSPSSSPLSTDDWTGVRRACALRRALRVSPPPEASGPKAGTGWLGEAGDAAPPPLPAWDGSDEEAGAEADGGALAAAELALLARQARVAMGLDGVSALLAADWSAAAPAAPGVAALLASRPGLAATLAAGAAAAASTYRRLNAAAPPRDASQPPAREGKLAMDGSVAPARAARRCCGGGAGALPTPRCAATWCALAPGASPAPRVCRLCGRLASLTPAPGDGALHAGAPVCAVCGVLVGPLGRVGGYTWPGLP